MYETAPADTKTQPLNAHSTFHKNLDDHTGVLNASPSALIHDMMRAPQPGATRGMSLTESRCDLAITSGRVSRNDFARELAQYPTYEVQVPVGSGSIIFPVYEIWDGILAAPFFNLGDFLSAPHLGPCFEQQATAEEFLQFVEYTRVNLEMLSSRPNGKALVDFFSSNKIIQEGQSKDFRLSAVGGERLEATLILAPALRKDEEHNGELFEFGFPLEITLDMPGATGVAGSPSVVQYNPHLAWTLDTGPSGKFYEWPWELLSHEMVHAAHAASGTKTCPGNEYRIPNLSRLEGAENSHYVIEGEEVFTHSCPYARTRAGIRDGVDQCVSIHVNGVREWVRMSESEVRLENGLLEKIALDGEGGEAQSVLVARRRIFGIGDWQIFREFGHAVRPMYNAPEGEEWKATYYELLPPSPPEGLKGIYPSLCDPAVADAATPVDVVWV